MVGFTDRTVTFRNFTKREVLILVAEEDFIYEREVKRHANAALMDGIPGGGIEVVSKRTGQAMPPKRLLLDPKGSPGAKPAPLALPNDRRSHYKVYTREHAGSNVAWSDSTLLLHYERELGQHQSEVHVLPAHMERVLERLAPPSAASQLGPRRSAHSTAPTAGPPPGRAASFPLPPHRSTHPAGPLASTWAVSTVSRRRRTSPLISSSSALSCAS